MKNVLVFPCGSEIGLEVNRALAHSIHFNLFGGSSSDDHGRFVYKNYIPNIPYVDDANFIEEINRIIADFKIDFIIPAHDSLVLKFAENQKNINATVITSDLETCIISRSKRKTYRIFENLIPTPKVFNINEITKFPVFLKPDVGQGSKGTYKANSKAEIEFYLNKDSTLIAMEFLPGKEYTIDCFTNKDGKLMFAQGRERIRISNGISVNSKPITNPDFLSLAEKINSKLSFRGVWFFQVKENYLSELVLMEIAPRIAGTMALFRANGINFILLSLFDRMGFEVSILNNHKDIEIDRALFSRYNSDLQYDYIYVDFDDTIVIKSRINTDLIKFLYQCRNNDKKIILITKHIFNIDETLSKYAISNVLFDEVISLKKDDNKSQFIKHKNAIFIDDSFAERKNVLESLNIPCFGIDALESLMDWKI